MFCKYCGQPLKKGTFCSQCGKENTLEKHSMDLDALMQGRNIPRPPQPPKPQPAADKTYQQGLTEGYENGKKEGYTEGKRAGFEAAARKKPWYVKKARMLGGAAALLLAVAVTVSGLIFRNSGHDSGYEEGFTEGQQKGYLAGEAAQQADQDALIERMQQEFDTKLARKYEEGYDQGRSDAERGAMLAATPDLTPAPTPAKVEYRDLVIGPNSEGNEVKAIQHLLIRKGYDLDTDGKYGKNTGRAVRDFQEKHGLKKTGEVDILTYWALLYEEEASSPTPTEAAPIETPAAEEKKPAEAEAANGEVEATEPQPTAAVSPEKMIRPENTRRPR